MKYDFNKAREEYPKLSKEELIEKLIVAEATNVAHCVTICEMQEAEEEAIAKIEERINELLEMEKTYATAEPFVSPETYWGELKGLEFALQSLKGK